jgi:hypothetical protein
MCEALGVIPSTKKEKRLYQRIIWNISQDRFRKCWISDELGFRCLPCDDPLPCTASTSLMMNACQTCGEKQSLVWGKIKYLFSEKKEREGGREGEGKKGKERNKN